MKGESIMDYAIDQSYYIKAKELLDKLDKNQKLQQLATANGLDVKNSVQLNESTKDNIATSVIALMLAKQSQDPRYQELVRYGISHRKTKIDIINDYKDQANQIIARAKNNDFNDMTGFTEYVENNIDSNVGDLVGGWNGIQEYETYSKFKSASEDLYFKNLAQAIQWGLFIFIIPDGTLTAQMIGRALNPILHIENDTARKTAANIAMFFVRIMLAVESIIRAIINVLKYIVQKIIELGRRIRSKITHMRLKQMDPNKVIYTYSIDYNSACKFLRMLQEVVSVISENVSDLSIDNVIDVYERICRELKNNDEYKHYFKMYSSEKPPSSYVNDDSVDDAWRQYRYDRDLKKMAINANQYETTVGELLNNIDEVSNTLDELSAPVKNINKTMERLQKECNSYVKMLKDNPDNESIPTSFKKNGDKISRYIREFNYFCSSLTELLQHISDDINIDLSISSKKSSTD
jgi:methyl-accepting chemotaxis protein